MTEASEQSHFLRQQRNTKQASHWAHAQARRGRCTPEFWAWARMWARCGNPHFRGYHNYGGRGIRVCTRWEVFANFFADMGPRPSPRHSLDRRDNNGHYTPSNCRWATKREQLSNRRISRYLTFGGETHLMKDWAVLIGIEYKTLWARVRNGWSVSDALITPRYASRARSHRPTLHRPNIPTRD